jgi:hypothetical protein
MDPLSWQDIALMLGAPAAIHADAETTKGFLARGGQETNPLFGTPHPSGSSVDAAEAVAIGAVGAGALALPEAYRAPFLAGVTGFEAAIASQNQGISKSSKTQAFAQTLQKPLAAGAIAALAAKMLGPDHWTPWAESSGKGITAGIAYHRDF